MYEIEHAFIVIICLGESEPIESYQKAKQRWKWAQGWQESSLDELSIHLPPGKAKYNFHSKEMLHYG